MTLEIFGWALAAVSALLLLVSFPGYGILLRLVRGREGTECPPPGEPPPLTILFSAFNEEDVVVRKLENALALRYPPGRMSVLVVSDASTDRTDELVAEISGRDSRVRLLRMERRGGKTTALNRAMREIDTPVVVFTDANAIFDADALLSLVRPFSDPEVGYVVGAAHYTDAPGTEGERTEGRYWRRELRLKELESSVSSVVGGDGAIYAIRRELYSPLEVQDINDFVNPLQIVARGYRGVFEPRARCRESTSGSLRNELRRKRRIVNRSFAGLLRVREVLNPFRHGWFAVQVWLHKVLRWTSPGLALLLLVGLTLMAKGHPWFLAAMGGAWGVLLLLGLMLVGFLPGKNQPFLAQAVYSLGVALASVRGILDALRGRVQVTWEPARPTATRAASSCALARAGSAAIAAGGVALLVAAFAVSASKWRVVGLLLSVAGAVGHLPLYSAFLRVRNRLSGSPKGFSPMGNWPSITLLVAAYNEEGIIRQKVENCLDLSYPGRLRVLVASDSSTDATDAIVGEFQERGVDLFRNPTRTGKAGLLARAVDRVDTDLVLFSDANVFYAPDAVSQLVRPFAEPQVGASTGSVRLVDSESRSEKDDVWIASLEKRVLVLESVHGSCVGVDGAMVAVRRNLVPLYGEGMILDDFILSMHVVNQGFRILFMPEARGVEYNPPGLLDELERRTRMVAGILQLYVRGIGLPSASSGLIGRFLVHKVWRWCSPLYLGAVLAYVGFLLGPGTGLLVVGAATAAGYLLLALLLGLREANSRFGHFLVYQVSTLTGLWRAMVTGQSGAWRRTQR